MTEQSHFPLCFFFFRYSKTFLCWIMHSMHSKIIQNQINEINSIRTDIEMYCIGKIIVTQRRPFRRSTIVMRVYVCHHWHRYHKRWSENFSVPVRLCFAVSLTSKTTNKIRCNGVYAIDSIITLPTQKPSNVDNFRCATKSTLSIPVAGHLAQPALGKFTETPLGKKFEFFFFRIFHFI